MTCSSCKNVEILQNSCSQSVVCAAAVGFPEGAGSRACDGAENFGKIVVISDPYGLRDGRDRLIALEKQRFGRVDSPLSDEVGKGFSSGQLFCQHAQLGAADVELRGYGVQGQLFDVMLIQIELQLLKVGALCGENHFLMPDIGGQGLQDFRVGRDFLLRILAELKKCLTEFLRAARPPVQSPETVFPLLLQRRVVQKLAADQISQGRQAVFGAERQDAFADSGVTAVKVEALFCFCALLHGPGVARHASLVTLGGGIDFFTEGRVIRGETDVTALEIQDICPDAGESVKAGHKFQQLPGIKKHVHSNTSVGMKSLKFVRYMYYISIFGGFQWRMKEKMFACLEPPGICLETGQKCA